MRGLEIGALHNPRLPRDHPNAFFLDHASAEELREKYATNALMVSHVDDIVDVDFVWRPGQTLTEAVGAEAPFDFVLASHVVEHIPNPIGWLQQVAAILSEGGLASLIVPDKRYCFDAKRSVTAPGQWIDAYLRGIDRPTFHQIFDHESNFLGEVSAADLWDGLDPRPLRRGDVEDPDQFAFALCLARGAVGSFVDVHCSAFTPESFVGLVQLSARLGLLPFSIRSFFPTEPGSFEFYCTLMRLPDSLDGPERRTRQLESCASALAACHRAETSEGSGDGSRVVMDLSERERRLIAAKRATMSTLRAWRARLRPGPR